MTVQMALRRIIINDVSDAQHIELREVDGDRRFTIVIGTCEAFAIERRIKKTPTPRPMTHDLIGNVVEEFGGELRDVVISELREHIYYAKLRVAKDGEVFEVDCRPSDAVAVAVSADVPIYVSEDVLSEVTDD